MLHWHWGVIIVNAAVSLFCGIIFLSISVFTIERQFIWEDGFFQPITADYPFLDFFFDSQFLLSITISCFLSFLVTHSHPPTSSLLQLQVTRFNMDCLSLKRTAWFIPSSHISPFAMHRHVSVSTPFNQFHPNLSTSDSRYLAHVRSSFSVDSPLLSSVTLSLLA